MIHKKMIIVGNTNVGKTSIMERFVSDTFEEMLQPTYQASQRAKIIQPPESKDKIKLNIWDTAGQEKHRSVTRMFYQNSDAALLVYDATYRESFDQLQFWIEDLKKNLNTPIMLALAGNKSDKAGDLVVSLEEAHNFAQKHDISIVMEVSAKQNTGITEVFEQISAELIKKHKEQLAQNGGTNVRESIILKPGDSLRNNEKKQGGGCPC